MNGNEYLESKGITQSMLARKMNCTRANVSLWFSGASSPTPRSIERIAQAMTVLGAENVTEASVSLALMRSREEYQNAKEN